MSTPKIRQNLAVIPSDYRLPDPPEREPGDMTGFKQLAINGNVHYLARHLGNPESTIVGGELYLVASPPRPGESLRYLDLLVAFNADPGSYLRRNGYIISEQGKPPDFVLEIASPATLRTDNEEKRRIYAGLGIPEYWRFNETEVTTAAKLAADQLRDGRYQPMIVAEIAEGVIEGYSEVLKLNLRWDHGQLVWHDPLTGQGITTIDAETRRADQAEPTPASWKKNCNGSGRGKEIQEQSGEASEQWP